MNPADLRREYASHSLLEAEAAANPIQQFERWWKEANESEIVEVNAMTLATASTDGMPSARIVLLKGYDNSGFVFFTNYQSYKSMQLHENPKACLVFYWKEVERQIRITGLVEKISDEENEVYFNSRPVGSRIGAHASPQSQVIENREWLDENYNRLASTLDKDNIKRPVHWGGYRVKPVIMEFWQGRPSRLHDRLQYSLEDSGLWKIERLAP
jgi:pyridoxamine 5'-phosphate oxidase